MTTRPKQVNNKNLEFKNYLLARMQCNGQGYMMLKDTTCKTKRYHLKNLSFPCKCPHVVLWIKALLFGPTNSPHYID